MALQMQSILKIRDCYSWWKYDEHILERRDWTREVANELGRDWCACERAQGGARFERGVATRLGMKTDA